MYVLIAAVVIVVIAFASKSHHDHVNEAWGGAARSLGLVLRPAGWATQPRLSGATAGLEVVVDIEDQGVGRNRRGSTRFRVNYPSLQLGLHVTREGLLTNVGRAFGKTEFRVGDRPFDDVAFVKGRDASEVRAFLTPDRRVRILRALQTYDSCEIRDTHVICTRAGTVSDSGVLRATIQALLRLAGELSDDRRPAEAPSKVDRARVLAEVIDQMAAAKPDEPPEAETPAEPDPIPDPALAPTPEPVPAPAAPAEEPPSRLPLPPLADPAPARDARETAEALFGGDGFLTDVKARFESNYLDREVRWQGRLKTAQRFSFDMVFPGTDGVRAVLTIARLRTGGYGEQEIQAVVHVPAETRETLASQIDADVIVTGRLVAVDPFLRSVFVDDGAVELSIRAS